MSFETDYAAAMAENGVTISPQEVPSRDQVGIGVTKLLAFFGSLDADTMQMLDQVSGEFPIKALLASPNVAIAPELARIFQAADDAGKPLSLIATVSQSVLSQPVPVSAPSTPTITGMTSSQFTLRERSSFFISWASDKCDNYHLSWRLVKPVPGSTNSGNVQEIKAPSNFRFTARIFDSQPGEVYEAQVQACRHVDIGHDACSAFSSPSSLTIPENTKSLRQFLLLSEVSIPVNVRGIGMGPGTVLGSSIRSLLHAE
jgi:hypothetical protein